jgi:hypothetical protein
MATDIFYTAEVWEQKLPTFNETGSLFSYTPSKLEKELEEWDKQEDENDLDDQMERMTTGLLDGLLISVQHQTMIECANKYNQVYHAHLPCSIAQCDICYVYEPYLPLNEWYRMWLSKDASIRNDYASHLSDKMECQEAYCNFCIKLEIWDMGVTDWTYLNDRTLYKIIHICNVLYRPYSYYDYYDCCYSDSDHDFLSLYEELNFTVKVKEPIVVKSAKKVKPAETVCHSVKKPIMSTIPSGSYYDILSEEVI